MAPRVKPAGPLGHEFRRLLDKRLKKAEAHLASATEDLETGVHDARKEFKASRSLVRMLRHLVSDDEYKTINSSLRDAGHAVAGLRDSHALGDAIDLLVAESGLKAEAKRPLRRAARRAAPTAPGDEQSAPARALEEARDIVAPLRKVVRRLDLPDDDPAPYVKGMARSYGEAREALAHGFRTRNADDIHEARKRVINWRYQLDAVSPIWPAVMRAEVGELQALREHLGQHNDIVMLEHQLEADGTPWARLASRDEWIDRCAALRPRLVERAEFAAGLLFAEPPKRRGRRIGQWWEVARRAPQ